MTPRLDSALTPSRVIEYLDRYIVGQEKAKRAVAVALRNRLRRRVLPPEMAREIVPKNILMVGPTGVGKTEIARRLATLVHAPFIKVEATKFTEVGYVGRDVESMIRDLVEFSVAMVRRRMLEDVQEPALERAEQRLIDALLPRSEKKFAMPDFMKVFGAGADAENEERRSEEDRGQEATRAKLLTMLREGRLADREVDVEVADSAVALPILGGAGMDSMGINLNEMLSGMLPKRSKKRRMKVNEALRILQGEEAEKLIDSDALAQEALEKVQEDGIIFLDELDKVVAKGGASGPDVSREGVQRDLLPIVEGSVVQTRYGPVKTDHILFIAAGAFSGVKPSDLIPELQGRFPIRVELQPLSWENLQQILTEPENSLLKQYSALISTEGVELSFTEEATRAIAELASQMNAEMEDIGARRLHTMLEQLLEEISFDVCDAPVPRIEIDAELVRERLNDLVEDRDIRRYLL
ncbi:ATP-dependent protease ATPase subunit HslU [Fretibacterium sp. OH1220_COT-178]|uniref:ATP-dependent protease ATPase subunit HslU n=1 Tax=Fretibacterium sp. OH1220_COT-178 TaxID=2491047 RepID=UPI000F5DF4DF|nr:ATP-dependent protease ATPase subunit HslU [Fretibacterium sp. OH1220_COT-178]RRD63556.1 ATP-dependent protease ATPase subunit HslU [Fretibacterium sp. OH1220_COT-178]